MDKTQETLATEDRIANLAIVGTLLKQGFSEENQDIGTNFFFAREALDKFIAGIELLDLPPASNQGMHDLVDYLKHKLDKRESGISQ